MFFKKRKKIKPNAYVVLDEESGQWTMVCPEHNLTFIYHGCIWSEDGRGSFDEGVARQFLDEFDRQERTCMLRGKKMGKVVAWYVEVAKEYSIEDWLRETDNTKHRK